MIGVLIADDHPVVRRGIRQILDQTDDIRVVGEASTATETLAEVRRPGCDVVLLDLSMPGSSGVELIEDIGRVRPGLPILVVTMHAEQEFALWAIRLGAAGYVTKDQAPSELVTAIRKVAGGGRYVSEWLGERLARVVSSRKRMASARLSTREQQVVRLIAQGHSTKEIAHALSISPKTVGTYRTRLREKLELKTSTELVAYAIRARIGDF